MFKKIKELLLNTPERYWLILFGYHIHKSFWGVLNVVLGVILVLFLSLAFGIFFIITGCIVLALSIIGQKYTYGKYKIEIWEKYK